MIVGDRQKRPPPPPPSEATPGPTGPLPDPVGDLYDDGVLLWAVNPPRGYWARGKLACAGGGGGHGSPPKEGGGSSNGAPVTETMVKSQFFPHFCHFFTEFRN